MFYVIISIILAILSPEIGVLMADSLRDFTTLGWDGFWFWVIGLFLYQMIVN